MSQVVAWHSRSSKLWFYFSFQTSFHLPYEIFFIIDKRKYKPFFEDTLTLFTLDFAPTVASTCKLFPGSSKHLITTQHLDELPQFMSSWIIMNSCFTFCPKSHSFLWAPVPFPYPWYYIHRFLLPFTAVVYLFYLPYLESNTSEGRDHVFLLFPSRI